MGSWRNILKRIRIKKTSRLILKVLNILFVPY